MRQLLSPFLRVGFATLLSRILGFVRDVLTAMSMGAGPVADAFFVAFRLPNLFRRLFAEGAFNAAFIPLFVRHHSPEDPEKGLSFAAEVASALLLVLCIITLAAELFMPFLIWILAPGFGDDSDKFQMALDFSRLTFPYLACMSLMALVGGILNALHRFTAAAFMPALLNLVMIGFLCVILLLGTGQSRFSGLLLSASVLCGGLVQLGILTWMLRRTGFRLQLRRPRWTPNLREFFRLGVPGIIAGGGTQLNIMVGTIIASLQEGAVSYLYYADRIYQLPLSIVGIGMGVVLLPFLASHWRQGQQTAALHMQNRAVELALALTLPACMALLLIPDHIIRILFERGAFSAKDTQETAWALMLYAIGLPGFVLNKVFSPAFFAREDTRTPMFLTLIAMGVNIVLALILFLSMGYLAVPFATSVSAWLNVGLLIFALKKRDHFDTDALFWRRFWALLVITGIIGGVIYTTSRLLDPFLQAPNLTVRALGLAGLVGLTLLVFGVLVQIGGVLNLKVLLRRTSCHSLPQQG